MNLLSRHRERDGNEPSNRRYVSRDNRIHAYVGIVLFRALYALDRIMSKFNDTYCSQCGQSFGPGNHGYSHCDNHKGKTMGKSIWTVSYRGFLQQVERQFDTEHKARLWVMQIGRRQGDVQITESSKHHRVTLL